MSTRILHGYRLPAGTDLFAFTHQLRAALNPVRDRVEAAWLMNHAVHSIDVADRLGNPRPELPLIAAMSAFDQAQDAENAKGHRQAESSRRFDPHRFEAAFALDSPEATGADTGTGRILVRIYCEDPQLQAAWEQLPGVEHYPYWDTDPEDGVNAEEWEERRAAWKRVMPHWGPPVVSMLTFALRSTHQDTTMVALATAAWDPDAETSRVALLREVAPTLAARTDSRVLDLLFEEAVRRRTGIADRAEAVKALPTSDLFGLLRRYRNRDRFQAVASYTALVEAARATLDPDAVDYVIQGADASPRTRPVNMGAAVAAAATVLDDEPVDED